MKYYIIAGEPSGDIYGAKLMSSLIKKDTSAQFNYWGGDNMLAVADGLVTHIRETSIMGFVEVVKNLSKLSVLFKKAKSTILDFNPDVIIFIDYPGFNLRMAKWAHNKNIKVVYYISPQVWAWKKSRLEAIKKYVDEMIVILPFEADFYQKNGLDVHYVGHPLLEIVNKIQKEEKLISIDSNKPILALLPGSRKQEIKKILPTFVNVAKFFSKDYHIALACAPNISKSFYQQYFDEELNIDLSFESTYMLLKNADLAVVTSGTATLETALFGVPQVVCYNTSFINYQIGKHLVDLKYISLVNLIMNKEVVPELIQSDMNYQQIKNSLNDVILNRKTILKDYEILKQKLSTTMSPSKLAAGIVLSVVDSTY
ncbi:MAG: lipid-A-disaccharide synthase [Saprospiraceae bacterium]